MPAIVWIVVGLALGVVLGAVLGYNRRKQTAEAQIGSAEAEATRLVNEAIKTADQNARKRSWKQRTRLSA